MRGRGKQIPLASDPCSEDDLREPSCGCSLRVIRREARSAHPRRPRALPKHRKHLSHHSGPPHRLRLSGLPLHLGRRHQPVLPTGRVTWQSLPRQHGLVHQWRRAPQPCSLPTAAKRSRRRSRAPRSSRTFKWGPIAASRAERSHPPRVATQRRPASASTSNTAAVSRPPPCSKWE